MCRVRSRSLLLASIATLAVSCPPAIAANGDLDPGFGSAGAVFTPVGSGTSYAHATALQRDGRIVVAGYGIAGSSSSFAVARYLPNGQLDTSFAGSGTLATALDSDSAAGLALAIQPDGKIIVGGYSGDNFALVRYRGDGTLDPTFGNSGIVTTKLGSADSQVNALALQADGRIIAAGYAFNATNNKDFAVVRYLANGSLDPSFGSNGMVLTAIDDGLDEVNGLAIQSDGKIIAAGIAVATAPVIDANVALARYLPDGTLDLGFGFNGKVIASLPASGYNEVANAVALQPDGKIVIAGEVAPLDSSVQDERASDFLIMRFRDDGTLDPAFQGGAVRTYFERYRDSAKALAIQPDNRILTAGFAITEMGNFVISIVRQESDGRFDTTFGSSGRVVTSASSDLYAHALALQADGKFVVAGSSSNNFALWRHLARDEDNDRIAEPWGLTPSPFSFNDVNAVALNTPQTSNLITIAGLETDLRVPVSVCGGEYAINGATDYTRGVNYVGNGDQINVRHLSAPNAGTLTDTVLSVGGWSAANNPSLLIGAPTRDTFTSLTLGTPTGAVNPNGCVIPPDDNGGITDPPSLGEPPVDQPGDGTALPDITASVRSGGGGAVGWAGLLLLGFAGLRRRNARVRS